MSASAASSSTASIAAAINDSKDDGREQVSDVVHDRTDDDNDVVSDDDVSDNEDEEMDEDVFFWPAQEIMNRSNKKWGQPPWRNADSAASLARGIRSYSRCGACWGRVTCAPRIASPSICFGISIF